MKSKFFKDTQGLESPTAASTPDKLSVCLRLDRRTYAYVMCEAQRLGVSSGEYLDRVLQREVAAERRIH